MGPLIYISFVEISRNLSEFLKRPITFYGVLVHFFMFKRLFGKTIKDETLDYPAAIRKIQELQKAGAEPIKLKIRQSAARPIVETRPSF